ncbi:hypothetical protein SLEP1_g42304 [Rubroshorea leprosula]|uniref:Uncharacterized protein n=1 Tax=Rubroshorea leprosula TaxID=152421 RepID=A0AAV5L9S4_9ROSI|nr:hypothetical protein SLEP1_g42304 [Rubroshorea leprosula]
MSSLQNFSQIAAGFFPNCSPVCSWRILEVKPRTGKPQEMTS